MAILTKLNIGDRLYRTVVQNNSFRREKIVMIDADGVEWYRYDLPQYEYRVVEYTYAGRVDYVVHGEVTDPETYAGSIHFVKNPKGELSEWYDDEFKGAYDTESWFTSFDEAATYLECMKANGTDR